MRFFSKNPNSLGMSYMPGPGVKLSFIIFDFLMSLPNNPTPLDLNFDTKYCPLGLILSGGLYCPGPGLLVLADENLSVGLKAKVEVFRIPEILYTPSLLSLSLGLYWPGPGTLFLFVYV